MVAIYLKLLGSRGGEDVVQGFPVEMLPIKRRAGVGNRDGHLILLPNPKFDAGIVGAVHPIMAAFQHFAPVGNGHLRRHKLGRLLRRCRHRRRRGGCWRSGRNSRFSRLWVQAQQSSISNEAGLRPIIGA